MAHLDDDDLVLYSFGEAQPNAAESEHLRTCSRCNAELVALKRLVSVGRTLDDGYLETPPGAVWERIHADLDLAPELKPVPQRAPASDGMPRADRQHSAVRAQAGRRSFTRRRRTTILIAAAALVIGVIGGIVGTAVFSRPDDPRLVAKAVLEPFPDWQASGSARVEEDSSGTRRIVVDLSAPSDGLMEVWLLDPDTSGLISLGLLNRETGSFALPDDVDLARYSVVDISSEPDDGDPSHSGDSIVRGPLRSS